MKKKYLLFFVLILLTFCLIGCQKPEDESIDTSHSIKPLPKEHITEEKITISEDVASTDNELIEKIKKNIIQEQSFDISLNDWGEVTFVSCMPDYEDNINPLTDISFYLLDDNKVLYHFPDVEINNIRETGLCEGVSFVYFEDINEDNKKDIVIGILYVSGAGPQGMIPYTEIRIYEDNGIDFIYNKSLCDEINQNLPSDVTAEYIKNII